MDFEILIGIGAVGAVLLLSVALTVGWVLCLVHAAQDERWGWFVVMLLFGVTAFVYFFLHFEWPEERRDRLEREGLGRTTREVDRREVEALRAENEALRRRLAEG